MIEIDLWTLLGLGAGFLGSLFSTAYGAAKIVVILYEKRQEERFRNWGEKLANLENATLRDTEQWQKVERELFRLKADLPVQYVRRDDFVIVQTRIEAKLDAMGSRLEKLGEHLLRRP